MTNAFNASFTKKNLPLKARNNWVLTVQNTKIIYSLKRINLTKKPKNLFLFMMNFCRPVY
jgi:hypothetical protein